MQQQGATYNVDIVMCIDATASMSPYIENVKARASKLHEDILLECKAQKRIVERLRVRIIAFRDYYEDDEPMVESRFYVLPSETESFRSFLSNIHADGGGDEPENGLEALSLAMLSPWVADGQKRRHVIVMFTDASTHELEKTAKPGNYPKNLPKNFAELTSFWMGQKSKMLKGYKRLVLFAPDVPPWSRISSAWDYVIHHPAQAANGLADADYHTILQIIVSSLEG